MQASKNELLSAWELVESFLAQETTLQFTIVCRSVDDFLIVLLKKDDTKMNNQTYITARGNTLLLAARALVLETKDE